MSRTATSTSSDTTKKVNVKLNVTQKKQFDIIAELKPEWTVDDIYQFCSRHDFDHDKLQNSLDSTFEVDQSQNDDTWMSIQKKPTSKQSAADHSKTALQSATTGGPKQKFDKQRKPRTDKTDKPKFEKVNKDTSAAVVQPADTEESKAPETDAVSEKKPYVKRERSERTDKKPYNKEFNKERGEYNKDRKPYNKRENDSSRRYNKRQEEQKQAEPAVPLPKPGISFLSALNTGLTKPKVQPVPPQPQQTQQSPPPTEPQQHADQHQAATTVQSPVEHKEQSHDTTPAIDAQAQREQELLAQRMAAVPQPRGVWKKKTQADIQAEQAELLAQQQLQQRQAELDAAEQLAQQQQAEQHALQQQQQQQQYAQESQQDDITDTFNELHVQQQSLSPVQQSYTDTVNTAQHSLSPEPATVPQPLVQSLPISTQFTATQPQSHSIFGSYNTGLRGVNELLSQNDPVVLPRHIQSATQSYPNISFGAFNLGNRPQPKELPTQQSTVQDTQKQVSVSPQPVQNTYASSNTSQQNQQSQQSRFGAALSPLLPSTAVDTQQKQPSIEPQHTSLEYNTPDADVQQNTYNQSYNDFDAAQTQPQYPAHYQTPYNQQQYDHTNNYYSNQQYVAPTQYDDNTYNQYNDQYRPKSSNNKNVNANKQPIGTNPRTNQQKPQQQYNQPQSYNQQPQQQPQYNQYNQQPNKPQYQQRGNQQQYPHQSPYQPPQQYAPVNKSAVPNQPQTYPANNKYNKPVAPTQSYPPTTAPYQYGAPNAMYQYGQPNMYSPYSAYQQPQYTQPPGFQHNTPQYPAQYTPDQMNYMYRPSYYENQQPLQQQYNPNSAVPGANEYNKQSPDSNSNSGRNTGVQDTEPTQSKDNISPYQYNAPPVQYNQYAPPGQPQYNRPYGAPQQQYAPTNEPPQQSFNYRQQYNSQ